MRRAITTLLQYAASLALSCARAYFFSCGTARKLKVEKQANSSRLLSFMRDRRLLFGPIALLVAIPAFPQPVKLVLAAGTPLQVSVERRFAIKHVGEPVRARLINPLYAFDQEVVPAGSEVLGHVARLDPINRQKRIHAMMGGDFTPLHDPAIEFDTLVFPDGTRMHIHTTVESGRGAVIRPNNDIQPREEDSLMGKTREELRVGFINGRRRLTDALQSPDKWQRLEQAGYSYLPYHPQFVPAKTQVLTQLAAPLMFGTTDVTSEEASSLGPPPPDSVVTARLACSVSSTSPLGKTVEAVVSQPLYSGDHRLLLPAGTRLTGTVLDVQPARFWRRGGQLRFAFNELQLPPAIESDHSVSAINGTVVKLEPIESGGIRVDSEGEARSVESKMRFVAPAVQAFLGIQVFDQDQTGNGQSQSSNKAWRAMAGASGFGLIGTVVSQVSQAGASGLGFYGAAWSVFDHIAARGHNVVLVEGTLLEVRFDPLHQ